MTGLAAGLAVLCIVALAAVGLWWWARRRRELGSPSDRTAFRALHTANLAAAPLREGLTETSAGAALRHLRGLLGAPAAAVTGLDDTLSWDGRGEHHRGAAYDIGGPTVASGRTRVATVACEHQGCPLRHAIVAPLTVEGGVVGTLQVYTPAASAGLVRATNELADWVSRQLELAELEVSRARMMAAEVRALRAQISPHFIYNSLSAIASFVRTDPERARELLLEFADYTRYSFRRHGDFTTLAEELRAIERYLVLERARFGERLQVTLRVAPEALSLRLPFLSLQPLVENAVRHGLEAKQAPGRVTIVAEDLGTEVGITVEDDGVGEDPERVRLALAGDPAVDSVGLANVNERLRSTYGSHYGLVVETAPGAGTKVTLRVPKFAPGVQMAE